MQNLRSTTPQSHPHTNNAACGEEENTRTATRAPVLVNQYTRRPSNPRTLRKPRHARRGVRGGLWNPLRDPRRRWRRRRLRKRVVRDHPRWHSGRHPWRRHPRRRHPRGHAGQQPWRDSGWHHARRSNSDQVHLHVVQKTEFYGEGAHAHQSNPINHPSSSTYDVAFPRRYKNAFQIFRKDIKAPAIKLEHSLPTFK